ncbi:MAG: Tyrosine recombinase XerC [Candidatus Roizmanbacteria bacterium GW2011_GWA2_35_19]|uniref:Tyrosine recombinase XerC n=2 Tax=Candidatus Roizmaniibacteriota TaxID=1752723 RepID=A0A0G0E5N8_9BACT|nr:MAG: Tyrosine recombinase XerC [Candidatus Roizmanbacteria bacterium GW2011_GWC2_35_12]KKP70655.1 MAG: Tyrosine recombinase XerC [Candidatus Roizmanbacteria bacterium GW2011_GWA2_35_19]
MDNMLLPSLVERFIKFLETQGKSTFTVVAYKKDLEQFSGYLTSVEIQDVREVKKENIEGFINKLIAESYTKKSASRKLNSIRTFFRYLKQEGIIVQNPSLDVSHPKYIQSPPRIFTKLEYRALRDFSKEDARTYALVEILLQTGIKIGELAGLEILDIKDGALSIKKYGKTPAREIPLNKAVKKAIDDYVKIRPESKDNHLFITRTGHSLLIRNIRQIISRCFRENGIENATVNDLRNTFIAHQLRNGASVEYIAKLVGHRRLSSTERFLNMVKEEVQKKEGLGEL